jgi:hypothetical protein
MRNALQLLKNLAFTVLLLFSFNAANASHVMGGDLTYVCIGPNQYSIVAKLFRDCDGITFPNTMTLNVSSANCNYNGSVQLTNLNGATNSFVAPFCDANLDLCNNSAGLFGVEQYFYRGILTLPACASGSDYVLSWSECCRNTIITTGAANAGSYIYITLNNTLAQCNNSPAFNFKPTVYFCVGQENVLSQGVTDVDGDQLKFSFTSCLESATGNVPYNAGFSPTSPLSNSSISIDQNTGQIKIFPTQVEIGVVCIKVEEFRNNVKISESIQDVQISVRDCGANTLPRLSGFNGTASASGVTGSYSYTGCVGEEIEFDINSFDLQHITQDIQMEWAIGVSGANFIIDDTSSTLPSAKFRWKPKSSDVGRNFFAVRIKDDACPINGISVYIYTINVQSSGLNFQINTPDTTICDTSTIVLQGFSTNFGPGIFFDWQTGDTVGLSCLSGNTCRQPLFTPQIPGNYQFICVMRNNGVQTNCVATDTVNVEVELCVNTKPVIDALVQDVTVMPNPTQGNATLSYNLSQKSEVRIEIFDMLGRQLATVRNENQYSGLHRVEIGEFIEQQQGFYLVRLTVDGVSVTKKILVQ